MERTFTAEPLAASGHAAVTVRKARLHDIPGLLDLINSYAAQGIMLPRTEFELSENIRDFSVALVANQVVACGALHFYSMEAAEVRSLAVRPQAKALGLGRGIIAALEEEGRAFDLSMLFAFTYVVGFFEKCGFAEVERGELPLKAWKDCLRCPKFQRCDEIAVVKRLREPRVPDHPLADWELVTLPTPIGRRKF